MRTCARWNEGPAACTAPRATPGHRTAAARGSMPSRADDGGGL
eukprot:CAMPEP_0170170000 /NCGR_PEP_ID=MMETSP0040_2-20121228/2953_1 /TAXON_ID=641309 /ORGANISM="Lotharella oceanica, Strain CCMP622" /LENGTH=42 /DNA_ID= /DNA_START= /DNA_END= /DNA_ORIENTATION=